MKIFLYCTSLLLSIMPTGNTFSMQEKTALDKVIALHDEYRCGSFFWLVTQPKLNNFELIHNNRHYSGINERDANGNTPLHLLVRRPDATRRQVKAMIKIGADPTICNNTKIGPDGYIYEGNNVYKYGIQHIQSPIQHFDHIYYGNKDVMWYIFQNILYKKTSIAAKQQKENKAYPQQ